MHFLAFKNPKFVLFILWLIATSLNINKAFHIDDTFHLEAARWVEHHPFRPMSGFILFSNNYVSISEGNLPPLYLYFIAFFSHFFGYHEIPLHLFQSSFTFLAIFNFYQIAKLITPKVALLITTFFALNPAFLVNQNLMVDIPVLSLHLGFIYLLIKPNLKSVWVRYLSAALILSLAFFVKYSSLPLIIILFIHPILVKRFKYAIITIIPILFLIAWSAFNVHEFGTLHINRSTYSFTFLRFFLQIIAFTVALGAITPFTMAHWEAFINKYRRAFVFLIFMAVGLILVTITLTFLGVLEENNAKKTFWVLFFINGFSFLYFALDTSPIKNLLYKSFKKPNPTQVVLYLWAFSIGTFIILFAPAIATRHILLVIPPLLLLSAPLLSYTSTKFKITALVFSGSLSLIIGISDWLIADIYRKTVIEVKHRVPFQATTWTVGYWGWQWYSTNIGMQPFVKEKSQVKPGDYFIIPVNLSAKAGVNLGNLQLIEQIIFRRNFFTFFSGSNVPGMYSSDYINPPWILSKSPIDTIKIYQVKRSFR